MSNDEDTNEVPKAVKKKIEERAAEISEHFKDAKKQYARKYGWVETAKRRLQKFTKSSKKGLRYFTLCGSDAIDVFLFKKEGLIEYDGKGYPGVCFCEKDFSLFTQAKEKLGGTFSWRRDIEHLVNDNTFKSQIPFDVINLDYTSNCFPRGEEPFSSTLKTIQKIIELQRTHSFDLFITFRAQRSIENTDAIKQLSDNMAENFTKYNYMKKAFDKRSSLTLGQLANQHYPVFLLVTLPKIIIGWGAFNGFITSNEKQFVYSRNYSSGTYHIIKFIFNFEAVFKSTSFADESRRIEEMPAIYKGYLESIQKAIAVEPIDVDSILNTNTPLKVKLENEVRQLIESHKVI